MNKLSFGKRLQYGVEAAGFFVLIGLFKLMGLDGASAFGGFLGRNVFARTGANSRARDNLVAAYPEKSEAEIAAILSEMWDNLGRTVAEYAHLDRLSVHGKDPRLEFTNPDFLFQVIKERGAKGVLIISGHFANWEVMPFTAAQIGIEGAVVYRPVNNPFIDRWMVKQRIRNGLKEQIAKGAQGTRRIFSVLRSGKSILLLADQKTNEGVPAPFFGRDAMTTPAPAALALKLGAVIVPARCERIGGARLRMTVEPPVDYTPGGDHDLDVLALTAKINQTLETMVRKRPSQWLWIHRRWPKPGDVPQSRRGREAQGLGSGSGTGVAVERDGSSRT